MPGAQTCFRVFKGFVALVFVTFALINISISSIYIDWKSVGLFSLAASFFFLIAAMIRLLYRIICCSSRSKLRSLKAMLECGEAPSESSLAKILELNEKDLDLLAKSNDLSSTEILHALSQWKTVLVQEAQKSKILLGDANHKMEKNVVVEGDMIIYTYSDHEWISYLQAKIKHEKKLLKILVDKQNEIVDVCKLKGKVADYESFRRSHDVSTEQCSICLAEYEPDSLIATTDCGHHYHQPCLRRWIVESSSCPLCKCEI